MSSVDVKNSTLRLPIPTPVKNWRDVVRPSAVGSHSSCTRTVLLGDGLPNETNPMATLGSIKHDVVSKMLISGIKPFLGEIHDVKIDGKIHNFEIDEYTLLLCDEVWGYVNSLRDTGYSIFSETEVDNLILKDIAPEQHKTGSIDIIAYNKKTKKLVIADIKTGRIPVDAEDNGQLICYAYYGAEMFDNVDTVELVILQNGEEKSSKLTYEDLEIKYNAILDRFHKIQQGIIIYPQDGDYSPCTYCDVKSSCVRASGGEHNMINMCKSMLSADNISDDDAGYLFSNFDAIRKLYNGLTKEYVKRIEVGEDLPFSILEKKSYRGLTNKKVMDSLREQGLTVEKPLSPKLLMEKTDSEYFNKVVNTVVTKTISTKGNNSNSENDDLLSDMF